LKTAQNSKFWIRFAVVMTVFVFFAGGKKFVNSASAISGNSKVGIVDSNADVSQVTYYAVEKISSGDFEGAEELINKIKGSHDWKAKQLGLVIDEYKQLSEARESAKASSYEKLLGELEDVKNGKSKKTEEEEKEEADEDELNGAPVLGDEDEDEIDEEVKKNNEAFLAIIKVKEYASDEQKEELLSSEFVQTLIEKAKAKAVEFEADGEWVDAYAHCYYWLSSMYPDDKAYKDHAEKLMQMAMIEMSLKDNSCETSADRHKGIKAEMLVRAIRTLEISYVSKLKYKFGEMARKSIEQCRLLGEVLYEEKEDVSYRVSTEKMNRWQRGLKAIEAGLERGNGIPKSLDYEGYIRIFSEVIALNSLTLEIPQEIIVAHFSEASLAEIAILLA
jgi:hypothetical protein